MRGANHESTDHRSAVGNGRLVRGGQTIGGVHANGASAREHPRRRAGHHYGLTHGRLRPQLSLLLFMCSSALFQRGIGVSGRGGNSLEGRGTTYFEKYIESFAEISAPCKIMSLLPVVFEEFPSVVPRWPLVCLLELYFVLFCLPRHPIVSRIRRDACAVALRG